MAELDARPLGQMDASYLYRLMNTDSVRYFLSTRPTDMAYWQRSIGFWLQDQNEDNFILLCDGAEAGWLSLGALGSDPALIRMLVVDPGQWRKGIGNFAIRWAEDYCRGLEISRLQVQTTEENFPACQLYRGAGYEVLAKKDYRGVDGAMHSGITFGKTL